MTLSKLFKKTPLSAALMFGVIFTPINSQAATLDDVVKSINNLWTLIASTVSTTVATAANLIYEENPSLPATITANTSQPSVVDAVKTTTERMTQNQIKQTLTQTQDLETPLAKLLASDTVVKASTVARLTGPAPQRAASAGDANMNFQSLIGPAGYTEKVQISRANNFIRYAGSLAIPLSDINWSTLTADQKDKLDNSAEGRKYKVFMRSLAAAQSVPLDNLYYLLSERTVVKDLGTKAGLTKADASPLEVMEYIATRRTKDQNWYNNMAQASPATIQRETLYVLAEVQQQLYQQHLINERILATLSVTQLQNMQNAQLLNREKIENVKQLLGINPTPTSEIESQAQGEAANAAAKAEEEAKKIQSNSGSDNSNTDTGNTTTTTTTGTSQ